MNNFPISVEQIAEGMTNASSAMAAAGNSFDETVALLTAANTTVQNASKASTALRTISARLRKTKTELDDLGESMEESTYDNLVAALTQHNVALTTIDGEYRSTFDIMKDISEHWSEMTNMEQAALAEAIAGTRQQTVFYSIVENFREATGAMEEMEHSAGSLASSYSIYTDTIEAHTTQFNTAWQKLSMDFVNSGMVKGIVDFGTSILDVADKLQRLHLLIPAIITSINAIKAVKLGVSLLTIKKNAAAFVSEITRTGTVTEVLKKRFLELSAAEQREITTQLQVNAQQQVAGATTAKQAMETAGLTVATNAQTSANIGLANSFKAVLASNPLGWITLAVSLIPSIVSGIKSLVSSEEDAAEKAKTLQEVMDDINSITSNFKSTSEKAGELIPKYVELAKGVDAYGHNIGLTDDAYKEFLSIQNDLVKVLPTVSSGIDENGDAMFSLKGNSEELTEALYEQLKIQKELALSDIANKLPELHNSLVSGVKDGSIPKALLTLYNIREMFYDLMSTEGANATEESLGGFLGLYGLDEGTLKELLGDDVIDQMVAAARGDTSALEEISNRFSDALGQMMNTSTGLRSFTSNLKQAYTAWMQLTPGYEEMSDTLQSIALNMFGAIDPIEYVDQDPEDVQNYIQNYIIDPLKNASPEVQAAVERLAGLGTAFKAGEIDAAGFELEIQKVKDYLQDAGIDAKTLDLIMSSADYSNIVGQIESVRRVLKASGEDAADVEEFLKTLSYDDITIAYRILSEDGSMTIDELIKAIEIAKLQASEMVEVTGFEDMFDEINKVTKATDKLADAMEKLRKGTALTKSEMIKLAMQYPELLKQSNLFTDGSIKGQQKLLRAVLECTKKQQDAIIDEKITELETALAAVKKQIEVEKSKQTIIMQIAVAEMSNKVDIEDYKTKKIAELEMLEAEKYAEIQDGEVKVNIDAMNANAKNTKDILDKTVDNTWVGYANNAVGVTKSMYSTMDEQARASGKNQLDIAVQNALNINDAWWESLRAAGQEVARDFYLANAASINASKNEGTNKINNAGKISGYADSISKNNSNIAGAALQKTNNAIITLSDELSEKLKNSAELTQQLNGITTELENEIENLKNLKNMSLDEFIDSAIGSSVSSSSSNSSTSSEAKKTIEDIEKAAEDALDKFVQYRVKVIKDLRKKEQESLKQQLNDLKEFYDKQKQMLRDARDEEKYLEEQSEKRKSVSTLRSQIEQLKNDNSAWAAKRTIELTEELADAEKELLDFEKDHAIDEQIDMLDSEYERIAADIQNSIDKIDEALKDPKALYNQALAEIESGTKAIYNEMKAYADANGDGHTNEADKLYQALVDAANAYREAGNSLPADINAVIAAYSVGGYASGTSGASRGLHRIYEHGAEAIFESANGNKYKLFSGGEKVLPADATNFLYKFAEFGANRFGTSSNLNSRLNSITGAAPAVINLGDIIINGNADERTVSEIRRAQRENVEMMLREFNKLRH